MAVHETTRWIVTLGFLALLALLMVGAIALLARRHRAERRRLRDRVEEARRLAELERFSVVGQVAAGVAHDLRSPLFALRLHLELAEEAIDQGRAPDLREDLDSLRVAVDQIVRIVDAMGEAGGRADAAARVDLQEAARTAMILAGARLRRLRARAELDQLLPAFAPPDVCVRILLNLVVNAAQAARERVTVRGVASGDRVGVEVVDDGRGVPPGLEERVFERDFTTKPPSEGTGLGLWMSRSSARDWGGEVEYLRRDGRTVFTFWLPRREDPSGARPAAA